MGATSTAAHVWHPGNVSCHGRATAMGSASRASMGDACATTTQSSNASTKARQTSYINITQLEFNVLFVFVQCSYVHKPRSLLRVFDELPISAHPTSPETRVKTWSSWSFVELCRFWETWYYSTGIQCISFCSHEPGVWWVFDELCRSFFLSTFKVTGN